MDKDDITFIDDLCSATNYDINSIIREFNILKLEEDIFDRTIVYNRLYTIDKHILNEIIRLSKNDSIICGSVALYLYGVIDRDIKDIDCLIDTKKVKDFKLPKKYKLLNTSMTNMVESFNPVICYKGNNQLIIDVFQYDKDIEYISKYSINVQSFKDIIQYKIDILKACKREKDLKDLKYIFNYLRTNYLKS